MDLQLRVRQFYSESNRSLHPRNARITNDIRDLHEMGPHGNLKNQYAVYIGDFVHQSLTTPAIE